MNPRHILAPLTALTCSVLLLACGSSSPTPAAANGGAGTANGGALNASGGMTSASGGAGATGVSGAGGPAGASGAGMTAGATSGGSANGGAGSGGVSGSGGSSSGGASTAGSSNADAFLIENYDSETSGKQPTGWDNFIAYIKNNTNPQGDTLALVDNTRAHSGTNSVHFHAGSNQAFITRALPTGTNKLYVRAWFYMTRQLGQNPGANHETLIGINQDKDDEVRFGEIKGVIGTNEVPTDNISPKMDMWGMGPLVPANTWVCIEVAFIGDQTQNELHAWANGTEVHSITSGDQWQNGTMPANWLNGKFVNVILGWQSFSNATNDIWMDDLVLSTSRINCN